MKQIIKNDPRGVFHLEHRGYNTSKARRIAITHLKKRGFNRFICYRDTQAEFAVQIMRIDHDQNSGLVVVY